MANLGNCSPSFASNQHSTNSNSDEAPAYHMNYDEFIKIVEEKSLLYTESTEDKFLDTLSDVIQKNYLSYDVIFSYINDLVSKETELYQFEHLIEHVPMNRSYPFQFYFDKFVRDKESLIENLTVLLHKIEPAYKFNERFLQMFRKMEDRTKIGSGLYKEMSKEAGKVIEINKSIEKLFQDFQINKYITILKRQRQSTKLLQSKERGFTLDKADESSNELIQEESNLFPTMMNILDNALQLDFETLVGSTKKFYDLFNESLNRLPATCAASSSNSAKRKRKNKFQRAINLMKNLSIK